MSNQWPRRETSPNPLDDAIDRAVRAMMNVDPRPGLRGRVLARLERSPAPAAWLPRLALASAILAAIVGAVFLFRPAQAPTRIVQQAADRSVALPAPAVVARRGEAASADASPAPMSRTAKPAVTETPIRMPRVADVFGSRNAGIASAASADAEEVVFTEPAAATDELPGAPPLIVVPQIVVAPLQLERIGSDRLPPRK
jgi:hypothetical protein